MGFGPKDMGGVWCFLLLAGVLLAAVAATAGAEEDGAVAAATGAAVEEEGGGAGEDDSHGNDMCDIKCQHWGEDYDRKQQCVRECRSREHHHPSHAFCEHKCQHWVDEQRRQQCVHYCEHYGFQLLDGGGHRENRAATAAAAEVEGGGADGEDDGGYANDACERKCRDMEGHRRLWEKCMRECVRYGLQLGGGAGSRENIAAAASVVAAEATKGASAGKDSHGKDFCDIKCRPVWGDDRITRDRCIADCVHRYGGASGGRVHGRGGWEAVAAGAILEVV